MSPIYVGVDIAGAANTWVCALAQDGAQLRIVLGPELATLERIVSYCEIEDVVAVCIDAQLTIALSEENGFRTSDLELRKLLPKGYQTWVASINSLMAVPVRGRLLADTISPVVGTLIETHPRASLLFGLGRDALPEIEDYKSKSAASGSVRSLWDQWCARFGIHGPETPTTDGALDALVCATVAYQFHHAPQQLRKLRHDVPAKTGHGPFYVVRELQPDSGLPREPSV